MKRMLSAWRRHPILVSGFLLALALTLFFSARTALFMVYWADPAHRDQEIAGWMTPAYVAMSWRYPHEKMRAVIGPVPERQRPSLDAIAQHQNIALDDLAERIETAIVEHRASGLEEARP